MTSILAENYKTDGQFNVNANSSQLGKYSQKIQPNIAATIYF